VIAVTTVTPLGNWASAWRNVVDSIAALATSEDMA
jgi:hypothetical protein